LKLDFKILWWRHLVVQRQRQMNMHKYKPSGIQRYQSHIHTQHLNGGNFGIVRKSDK